MFPITELALKFLLIGVMVYCFWTFFLLITFFRIRKEERMTPFKRHVSACKHSTLEFMCKFLAFLNLVEYFLSWVYPFARIYYVNHSTHQRNDAFTYEMICGFLVRCIFDFLTSMAILFLFYTLGLKRLAQVQNVDVKRLIQTK